MASLRDFLFVDDAKLTAYIEQISSPETEAPTKTSKIGVSLTSIQYERGTASRVRNKTSSEKIDELLAHLKKKRLLGSRRPEEMYEYQHRRKDKPPFHYERTVARKIIFPTKSLETLGGVKQLAIWISDPNPKSLVPEEDAEWTFKGSFLYLTEMHLDDGPFQTVYSGCSALQAIANAASGATLLDRTSTGEPLGRGSYLHPIEKLASMGCVVGDKREIETLYRIRYMTNEQCISKDGKEFRVNDILGYPIYIAQVLDGEP